MSLSKQSIFTVSSRFRQSFLFFFAFFQFIQKLLTSFTTFLQSHTLLAEHTLISICPTHQPNFHLQYLSIKMRFTQFFNYLAVGSLAGIAAAAPLGTRTLEVEEGEQLASRSTNAVVSVSALAVTSVNDSVGKSSGSNSYTKYTGDGSTADGWPAKSDWLSFDAMWEANKEAVIAKSCSNNGWGQDNSATETANIKSAIEKVAKESKVDHRFILAVVLQESKGCVRVPTTANSVSNPGLMQSFQGTGTCYGKSTCSDSEIVQMIRDGAIGTSSSGGYGLASYLDLADRTGVAAYYRAARLYNSGVNSLKSTTNLDLASGATSCYASDIANRLTGWTTATSKCSSW
ncbi:hypothetical protein ABZX51_005434 [Aspergillus tubingensis]